ncbi:MAG: hypothetical protein Q7S39_01495 [Ignavibacteria bacterium]|nr:hypothetical protein [Ignavibacteria bacterium]
MLGEETIIFITFLLAIIGYSGLTTVILFSLRGKIPFLLWRTISAVILAHVVMVWAYHYN